MSEAPPSANNVSPERLNQLAGRKLSSLGVPVRVGADRRTLEGEFSFKTSQVTYPGTEQPIPRGRFAVHGHDHLRFQDTPLSVLGDVLFFDLERPAQLEERVGQLLRQRMQELDAAAVELRRLKLPYKLDAQRVGLRTAVKAGQHTFELVALPGAEARVVRVEPAGGTGFEVAGDHPALRLPDFRLLADLELYLSTDVDRMRHQAEGGAQADAAKVEPVAPRAGELTLGLLVQRLGADTVLSPTSALELFQDFQVGAIRYRLALTREDGTNFRAELSDGDGEQQSEVFELAKFPGAAKLVAGWAQVPVEPPPPEESSSVLPQILMPRAGDVWVMHVLIEQEAEEEMRYVCVDTDGKPYGASRILKRVDFESAFVRHATGWRLLIQIDEVHPESVVYRQLDGQRQTRGPARKLASGVLVATFLPEEAAY